MKNLGQATTPCNTADLDVFECDCGFHVGFDTTFLDQVGDITFTCPSCNTKSFIKGYFDVEDED